MTGLKTKKGRGEESRGFRNRNARSLTVIILQISRGVHLGAPRCASRGHGFSLFLSSSSSFFPPLSHNGIAKNSILPETVKNNASLAFFCLFSDCSLAYEAQREKQGQVGGKIRNGLLESEAENTARERRLLDFSSRE